LTVVTDLETVNHLWFHPVVDLCLVPTQIVYDLAIAANLPPEKVKITGIPVHPEPKGTDQASCPGPVEYGSVRTPLVWRVDICTAQCGPGPIRTAAVMVAGGVMNYQFPGDGMA
jgi:hypothetical protein